MKQKRIVAVVMLILILVTPITVTAGVYVENYIDSLNTNIKQLEEKNISLMESHVDMSHTIEQYEFVIDDNRKNYNDNIYNMNESLQRLKQQNNELMKCIEESGTHIMTSNFTEKDIDLLSRCAQAEAGYGNYQSQIYVVNVILNRVHSDQFPDTIEEVIYQHSGQYYQFTVAKNGAVRTQAREDTVENVKDALLYNKMTLPPNILFFHATGTESNCTPYIECQGSTFGY